MKNLLKEFKEFALRGNVMELAVAVIMGAAFQGIISSLTGDIISPVLGLFGGVDFSNLAINIGDASIRYGAFVTAVINFIIMAFVIFLMVKGMNKLAGLRKQRTARWMKKKQKPVLTAILKYPKSSALPKLHYSFG